MLCLRRRLGAQDVVELERLVDLGEPLSPIRRPPAPALIQRQLELAEQTRHLFARGDVAEVRLGAEGGFVDIADRRRAARKELPVNAACGEPVNRTETEPER